MKIEMWDIDRVQPYERNPRHNEDAIGPVAKSIEAFGWRQPIVVDGDGIIVVGHTRWLAARKLGLSKVPVHVATDLTADQVKAYRLADNRLNEIASWNFDLLPIELADLQSAEYDLTLLGFDQEDLAKLLGGEIKEGLTDPDDIPEPPDEPVTQPGDLWILGNHRLLCGDSGSVADLDRLLDGQPIHLVNTDPPYNVKVEPRSKNAIAAGLSSFSNDAAAKKLKNDQGMAAFTAAMQKSGKHGGTATVEAPTVKRKMRAKDRPLVNDFVSDEEFERLLDRWFGNLARVLLPGRSAYIWGGYGNIGVYPGPMKRAGLYFSQAVIWDKMHPVLTRKDFLGAHEICFYSWKEGAGHKFYGPNNITDIWHVKKIPPQKLEHLTGKPAELAVRAIQYSSVAGENVLDLFGGSGSTLIACEQTGRRAFLMEIDTAYCDTIVDRFQRFTGIPAVLERTGESPIPMKPREENMR
ncbi:MAG: DNA modification methylase [Pirellulales bacterium]